MGFSGLQNCNIHTVNCMQWNKIECVAMKMENDFECQKRLTIRLFVYNTRLTFSVCCPPFSSTARKFIHSVHRSTLIHTNNAHVRTFNINNFDSIDVCRSTIFAQPKLFQFSFFSPFIRNSTSMLALWFIHYSVEFFFHPSVISNKICRRFGKNLSTASVLNPMENGTEIDNENFTQFRHQFRKITIKLCDGMVERESKRDKSKWWKHQMTFSELSYFFVVFVSPFLVNSFDRLNC